MLLKGRAVTLRHLRMNSSCGGLQELPPVDQNLQYDFNFQQTNLLTSPVNVMPVSLVLFQHSGSEHVPSYQGDILQVACTYSTTGVNNVTVV